MFAELSTLLEACQPGLSAEGYAAAIINDNLLGKPTASTRRLTAQRLSELYGLDPGIPLFRVLTRLWDMDKPGRPLLALLGAMARDPLLRSSSQIILATPEGTEFSRSDLLEKLAHEVGDRLNESVLNKVARNLGSSWTQSGHLVGRVRKVRRPVQPTPAAVAFAMWLGIQEGYRDRALLTTVWARVLDRTETGILAFAQEAKRLGLMDVTVGGGIIILDAPDLDPGPGGVEHGSS